MSRVGDFVRRLRGKPRRQAPGAMPTVRYATSPLLASRTPPWRVKFLIGMIGLGFAVLIGRAAWIQIIHNDFYLKQGASRYERRIELPAARGRITDRHGELLASSVPAPSLWAIPKDMDASDAELRKLAKLLAMPLSDLKKRLASNPNFVWLRRQVDDDVAQQVAALKIDGVYELRESKRQYPEGEAAAHVVGFTNIEDQGQEGIELAYQKQLAGHDGVRHVIKDRLGRVVESVGDLVPAEDGQPVNLSIDAKIQFYAYQCIRDAVAEHKAKAGSVVVLDALTGEVLALANVPSYTPADRRNLTGAQLRNRALTDTFEPGSTMKPLVVSIALETGRVKPSTIISTAPGRLTVDGSTITDSHPHGDLTVEEVIQKSSNVGTAKLALQMQPREMWDMFTAVGLGQKPQLGFPGVVTGRLRPYKSWRRIEQVTMSYGYGLSASLFQLAQAYTIFATDGTLTPVTMLKRGGLEELDGGSPNVKATKAALRAAESGEANRYAAGDPVPVLGHRVISPETARAVRKMLSMVTGPGGTAPKAQAVGYSVGGKTGTAHKQEGRGYSGNKYRAWFVGIAPINKPRIVVAVMVDEPGNGVYYGGEVAAPVFSKVVQQTLNRLGVLPDLAVQPKIVQAELESF
ncbi:penicillin-binding protein 2 [Aquabacterium sp.]|uniref:peptidoglycan D,D-transpeptidase FtsI family protein n=1 Tax=Aquabacterium sp. TaxID=1872578 RepID=UPI002E326F55|nr:penicillin-binding protein 2 [Aquabacterium sp.]HEX5312112.1 penicillin-binding protein 2 [Aquabacterium sp.]